MAARTDDLTIRARWQDQGVSQGTKQVQTDMERLNRTLRTMAQLFGVAFGVAAVRQVGALVLEAANLSGQAENAEGALRRMAVTAGTDFTTEMNLARQVSQGMVSDLELMQRVGRAVDAGLTFSQVRTVLEYLTRFTQTFGGNLKEAFGTVTLGLIRGSVLLLDDYNVLIDPQSPLFQNLSELEKKQAIVNEAIRQMGEGLNRLPTPAENATTQIARFSVEWENFLAKSGRFIGPVLGDVLRTINQAGDDSLQGEIRRLEQLVRGGGGMEAIAKNVGRAWSYAIFGGEKPEWELQLMERRIAHLKAFQQSLLAIAPAAANAKQELKDLRAAELAQWSGRAAADTGTSRLRSDAFGAFEASSDAQRWRPSSVDLEPVDTKQLDQFRELPMALDAELMQSRVEFLANLRRLELEAAEDRVAIEQFELEERINALRRVAVIYGATEDELTRLRLAGEQERTNIQKREEERRVRERQEEEIRKVLLIVSADASQVKTQSDLAAYSLGLLVERLGQIGSAVRSAILGIEQMVIAERFKIAGGAVAGLTPEGQAHAIAGAVGIAGAVESLVSLLPSSSGEFQRLQRAIEASADAAGEFARQLESQAQAQITQQFQAELREFEQARGRGFGFGVVTDFIGEIEREIQRIDAEMRRSAQPLVFLEQKVAAQELIRMFEKLQEFSGQSATFSGALETFNHLVRLNDIDSGTERLRLLTETLKPFVDITQGLDSDLSSRTLQDQRRLLELVADLQRDIADEEIRARQEQADKIIDSVKNQSLAIQRALDDAMEGERQASLRAVRLRFDVQEAQLRQQYFPQLFGARTDSAETDRIVGEMQQEIEFLRLSEAAAATAELAQIRAKFDAAREATERTAQMQIDAVQAAVQNLGLDFRSALAQEIGGLSVGFFAKLDFLEVAITGGRAKFDVSSVVDVLNRQTDSITNSVRAIDITQLVAASKLATQSNEVLRNDIVRVTTVQSQLTQSAAGATVDWLQTINATLHDQTLRLTAAIHQPDWTRSGSFGGGGGQTTISINIQGGGQSPEALYYSVIEPLIMQSINEGRIQTTLAPWVKQYIRADGTTGVVVGRPALG